MPPPMAVRLAADLRPSVDGSAVCTWLSCRQPECIYPRAAACLRLGQTDGSQYRLMPPYGGSGALYLGLQENNEIVITVNTVIMGTCRGLWLSL